MLSDKIKEQIELLEDLKSKDETVHVMTAINKLIYFLPEIEKLEALNAEMLEALNSLLENYSHCMNGSDIFEIAQLTKKAEGAEK